MILVVDDNPIICNLIADVCRNNNVTVESVGTGEEAVMAAALRHYDLIFMDLHLDGICGVDAAIEIRKLAEPFCNVPIIALSGLFPVRGMSRWEQARFSDTVVKPFSISELEQIILKYARPDQAREL